MKKLSVIIPAHNEERRIERTLDEYSRYFNAAMKKEGLDYELIVVINNTHDNTEKIVKAAKKNNSRIQYLNLVPGGKGFAVMQGFKQAVKNGADLIGFVDADMATSPKGFNDLVKSIGEYDGVIASRWMRESVIINPWGILGDVKSWIFNFIVRVLFLFPYSDTQCGAKLFTNRAIRQVQDKIGITRWAFDIDLLYTLRKEGFVIAEVPTTWENKAETKIKLVKASLEMFLAAVRLRLLNSPFDFIVRSYDELPEKLKMHHRIWK